MPTKPGVLSDHRTPRSQVAYTAIAEPATGEADVEILRHGELAGGFLNELTIGMSITRYGKWVAQLPTVLV